MWLRSCIGSLTIYICFFYNCKRRVIFKKDCIYLYLERGEGREDKGEKHQCVRETWIGCLLHTPNTVPGPQPRQVSWEVIEPMTFWFTGWCLIHWATPARAEGSFFKEYKKWEKSLLFAPESNSFLKDVLVRVLLRNRANRKCVCVCRKRFIIRNWLVWLWRLRSPKTCSVQAGDPREPML